MLGRSSTSDRFLRQRERDPLVIERVEAQIEAAFREPIVELSSLSAGLIVVGVHYRCRRKIHVGSRRSSVTRIWRLLMKTVYGLSAYRPGELHASEAPDTPPGR